MAAREAGAKASGCLVYLTALFVLTSFLPTGSGFAITSIGNFAQCSPTVITWDIGQSLPPFTISITVVSGLTDDGPLLFTGFEGTSATVTVNLPAKTRVNLALENSGGVLREASNLVVQPGTESDCANSALSGSVSAVAATNSNLPGFSAETSDSSTSADGSLPIVTSSSPLQLTSTDHSTSPSTTDPTSSIAPLSTSTLHSSESSRTTFAVTSTSTSPFRLTPLPLSISKLSSSTSSSVSPSSLNSVTPGNGLKPGIIGAIVACSILGFAFVLWLLFWCKRRRQYHREMRHTRLPSPEPREVSLRDSVIGIETVQGLRPPSIVARDLRSPSSVNATIGLPSAEAIMEHRNKPLPTPTTPSSKARTGFASSPSASSSSQPMTSPVFATPTPTSFAMAGPSRAFAFALARRTHDSGRGSTSDSVFDGSDVSSDFTAPPPYDVYE